MIDSTTARREPLLADDPLSTAAVRYQLRTTSSPADQATSGPARPFGLRAAQPVPTPVVPAVHYCPRRQLAIDASGMPLIETMGKEWKTKSSTNGDEGPEENWGWEEEPDPEPDPDASAGDDAAGWLR